MATIREIDVEKLKDQVMDEVISLQRDIHQHPEIGFDTVRTAALVAEQLRSVGIDTREQIGKTGVVGDIDVPGATRRIAFRADMDALPMDEEADLPHKSKIPGAAHMCGHDAHTAMLVGAAKALLRAPVVLVGAVRNFVLNQRPGVVRLDVNGHPVLRAAAYVRAARG